jgi:hypothetical protein
MSASAPIDDFSRFWKQTQLPVIFQRQRPAPLLIRLPYAQDNKVWLRNGERQNRLGIAITGLGKFRRLGLSEQFA